VSEDCASEGYLQKKVMTIKMTAEAAPILSAIESETDRTSLLFSMD
jgi:hypothetical protein